SRVNTLPNSQPEINGNVSAATAAPINRDVPYEALRIATRALGVDDELRAVSCAPHRQPDLEVRTGPPAVDELDRPAVRLDAFRDDGQTDARAPERPALQAPSLIERLEDPVSVLGRDARPGIGDLEHELRLADLRADVDRAAVRQELDRVRDEVLEHEPQLAFVRAHVQRADVELKLDLLVRDQEPMLAQDAEDQRLQLEVRDIE